MKLYELDYACRLYSGIAGSDEAYVKMRSSLGEDPKLASPVQLQALMKFLNEWRCRIPLSNFEKLKQLLRRWADDWIPQLPAPTSDIRLLIQPQRETVGQAYQELVKLGTGLRFSHTAAAKTLHALRPQVLPPWDGAVREDFSAKPRPAPAVPGQLYPAFIEHVAEQLRELDQDARRLKLNLSLPEARRKIARPQEYSLVKLADEYAWVTVTLGHQIPDRKQLETWLRWCP